MKYLLDTHILLWAIEDPDEKLSNEVADIIFNTDNEIYFSTVSIWEATIKRMKNPDKILNITARELISICEEANFNELHLTSEHVYALETLTRPDNAPPHHDPFDRILIAQAKSEDMIFLTHDDNLALYHEPCVIVV